MKKDKTRDMIRSILPSTRRRYARKEKAFLSRGSRHAVRIDLRKEDAETSKADLARDPSRASIVSIRRGGDKLNHFLRWCRQMTEGMTTEEKLGFVRGLLPRNLVGDHAYSHWEWEVRWRYRRPKRRNRMQSATDSAKFRLRRALAIDPDLQRRLNTLIKERKPEGEPRRLLLGVHDIDAFIDDTFHRFMTWLVERTALFELMMEIDGKGGHEPPFQFSAITAYRPWPPGVTPSNG